MSTSTLETIDQEITGLFKEVTQVMWKRLSGMSPKGKCQFLSTSCTFAGNTRVGIAQNAGSSWLGCLEPC